MNERKTNFIKFLSCTILLFIAYFPTFVWMADRWAAPESYYGHGFLIPLVSLYIAWQRRNAIAAAKKSSEPVGIILIVLGLAAHLACALLRVYFLSGFSFVLVLFGVALYFYGREVARNLVFPIFFLLAMIPLPLVLIGNLTVKLKLFAAEFATFILNRIGFPSVRDGSIIRMPQSQILIEAPCSGLRSLIALLTLGLLFAFGAKISYPRKTTLLLSAIPIALASNIIRILMLATVNDLYGGKAITGFFHDFSGFFVFAFAFTALLLVMRGLEKNER